MRETKKYTLHILICIAALLLHSCEEATAPIVIVAPPLPTNIIFSNNGGTITEEEELVIALELNRNAPVDFSVTVEITNSSLAYGTEFQLNPAATDGKLKIDFIKGEKNGQFIFISLSDNNTNIDEITFEIVETSTAEVSIGNTSKFILNILDSTEDTTPVDECYTTLSSSSLDVITWNLETFPTNGTTTLNLVEEIVLNIDADIIAVQEVNNIAEFNQLIDNIEGWEGFAIDVSGAINLGYLYKTSEIEIIESATIALESIVEPRPAGKIKIRHKVNGLEVTLFNIHLKCCGSTGSVEANRREAVSIALEAYINSNLPNEKIIVLGDWNDDLFDGPFDNFLNDDNFKFADESIALGATNYWSYPYSSQYLSHLDHILITNELFSNLTSTKTIVVDECISNYQYNVSDHRAVMASFE